MVVGGVIQLAAEAPLPEVGGVFRLVAVIRARSFLSSPSKLAVSANAGGSSIISVCINRVTASYSVSISVFMGASFCRPNIRTEHS